MLQQVKEKLEAVGFSFHFENAFYDRHWYCWDGPLGGWDIEVGPDCNTAEQAVLSALDAVLDYAVEFHERTIRVELALEAGN